MVYLIAQPIKTVNQKFGVGYKEAEMFHSDCIIDGLIGIAVGLAVGSIICIILNILHDKPWR